jgi:hypothetical protein
MKGLIINVDKDNKIIDDKSKKSLINSIKCNFCGISTTIKKHNHFKNDGWFNSCSLCYYTENLDKLISMNKGDLIFLPEISQVELFGILRMCWQISYLQNINKNDPHLEEVYDSIMILEEALEERKEHAETLFANGASNVNIMVDFLHSTELENKEKALKYLRWLPNKNNFIEEIEFWSKEDLKKFNPNNFKKIIQHMEKQKK